jgi:hypothetical protein
MCSEKQDCGKMIIIEPFSTTKKLQSNSVITNSVITNSVINEHLVITNRYMSQIGNFSTQFNPVIMNPGLNKQKWCSF